MATAKKRTVKASAKTKKAPREKVIGKAEHFFDRINVVTTTLKNPLKVGDLIHIKGHTTDMVQTVESIQIEHQKVLKAKKGDGVGIKVYGPVRDTDIIYLADKKSAVSRPSAPAFNPILPGPAKAKVEPLKRTELPQTGVPGARFFNF